MDSMPAKKKTRQNAQDVAPPMGGLHKAIVLKISHRLRRPAVANVRGGAGFTVGASAGAP
jgi:hypothetical protein